MTTALSALQGVLPPLTTPFAAAGSVDLAALAANVEKYNRTALAGYVVLGSTGEVVYLREEEKYKVWETVRVSAAREKFLIAGTGCEATAETITLTRRAADLGYQAALVRTPSYFKAQMTEAAWERHFGEVADASPIPVLLYSVPQFTGLAMEAPLVARLAAHPNIFGIKDSSGNVQRVAEMLRLVPPDFQLWVGSATTLYPSLCLGARGGILAVACMLPELCTELHQAYRRGDHARARTLQQRLLAAIVAVTSGYGIAGLKFAMELRGYAGGLPRAPLQPLDAKAKAELTRVLRAVSASG